MSKRLLTLAGASSLAVAIFQAVISFSPSLSGYFGAPPELVAAPPLLLVTGLVAAVIFAVFGLYGLSGAGHIRRLPLLRPGLLGIGGIYVLRGLVLVLELLIVLNILPVPHSIPPQEVIASSVALVMGLLYLIGMLVGWKNFGLETRA